MSWLLLMLVVEGVWTVAADDNTTANSNLPELLWPGLGFHDRNCRELQEHGQIDSGVYTIYPYDCCPKRPVRVYCDMVSHGGGWTVIQRRNDILPREEFFRTRMEYILGFGNLSGEFWLGLDHIHALTHQTLNQIRLELEDFDNFTRWAQYQFFYVHDGSSSFKFEVRGYTGDARDCLHYGDNTAFSTRSRSYERHGWWLMSGSNCKLNDRDPSWYVSGRMDSLKRTEMKLRPAYRL